LSPGRDKWKKYKNVYKTGNPGYHITFKKTFLPNSSIIYNNFLFILEEIDNIGHHERDISFISKMIHFKYITNESLIISRDAIYSKKYHHATGNFFEGSLKALVNKEKLLLDEKSLIKHATKLSINYKYECFKYVIQKICVPMLSYNLNKTTMNCQKHTRIPVKDKILNMTEKYCEHKHKSGKKVLVVFRKNGPLVFTKHAEMTILNITNEIFGKLNISVNVFDSSNNSFCKQVYQFSESIVFIGHHGALIAASLPYVPSKSYVIEVMGYNWNHNGSMKIAQSWGLNHIISNSAFSNTLQICKKPLGYFYNNRCKVKINPHVFKNDLKKVMFGLRRNNLI